MHAASDNPQPLSIYDPSPPRSRQPLGIAASIWAPQPQPSDTTWPKTLERELERHTRSEALHVPLVRREDVFGPEPPRSKDVGAIGDGRKKNSPGFDDNVGHAFFFPSHRSTLTSAPLAR